MLIINTVIIVAPRTKHTLKLQSRLALLPSSLMYIEEGWGLPDISKIPTIITTQRENVQAQEQVDSFLLFSVTLEKNNLLLYKT